ncbi:MAG TPA: protein kinase [Blastocatellia bacterium]|nr:protein kinase [Blastocatellia bacterium]
MTPERWREIDEILQAALERAETDRRSFLDTACATDATLRGEVEAYLAAHRQAGDFLGASAIEWVATMGAQGEVRLITIPLTGAPPTQASRLNLFESGSLLDGRYVIEKEIGQGGIGVVYLARDRKLSNYVVIKTLIEPAYTDRESEWIEEKFRQEIEVMARISHPGVVGALDVGALPGGSVYLVMQYIPGPSLRDAITAGGMDLARAGALIKQLGRALAAVHEHNVIHRDLKPENVLLQQSGGVEYAKIIDFGVAKVRAEMSDAADEKKTLIAGTPAYIAPEQLQGLPTTASDIYALGVIAYEMLTGQRPITTNNMFDMARMQREGNFPRPRQLRPELPAAAEAVILRALAFDLQHRYDNAREFGDDLASALTSDEKENRPQETERIFNLSTGKVGDPELPAELRAVTPPRPPAKRAAPLLLAAFLALASVGAYHYATSGGPKVKIEGEPLTITARQLGYSLKVKPNLKQDPGAAPFDSSGAGIIFKAGDQVRLIVSSPQSGYLYVINEGPAKPDGLPDINVLFPDTTINGGSAQISANQPIQFPRPSGKPEQDWFIFDREEGVEKLWLIWSERGVPEMEDVKGWGNPKDKGVIGNPQQIISVKKYLEAQSANQPDVVKDDVTQQTKLKAKGETLAYLVKVEHR